MNRMVVAAGNQGGTGRGGKRRGVELVVLNTVLGQFIQMGGWNRAAERAGSAKTLVIDQDQEDVG